MASVQKKNITSAKISLSLQKGWYFYEKGLYTQAKNEGKKGLSFLGFQKLSFSEKTEKLALLGLIGESENWSGNPQKGIKTLTKAVEEKNLVFGHTRREMLAGALHLKLADAYAPISLGPTAPRQDDSAYYHYRKALYHYSNYFNPDSTDALVPADYDLGRNSRMLRICLDNFTKVLLRIARRTGRPEDWQNAYRTQRLSVISLEDMRNRVGPDSRIIMAKLGRKTYEQAIALAFEMAEAQPGTDSMYAIAFRWAEAAKAFELRMHLQDAEAALQAEAPDSLVREGRRLKLARNYYENEYENLRRQASSVSGLRPADSTRLATLERQRYDAQSALRDWEHLMQDLIPSGLRNTEPEALSVEEIQLRLKPEEALLSFFYGDSAVYAFWIDKHSLKAHRIGNRTEIDQLVRALLDELYQPSSMQAFVGPSYQLYQTIFSAFPDKYNAKSLLICPDGLLGYLPFACLLTEEVNSNDLNNSYAQRSLPYLQNLQSQRYAYGAALHFQSKNYHIKPLSQSGPSRGDHVNKLAAFAPTYANELSLAFNGPQAESIATMWRGDLFPAEKAREQRFRELLNQYGMFHLAQHGEANLEQPLSSRLRFTASDDSLPENDGLLHAYEIYALDIPAQLVVLSSCESGYGPLAKGEGVMSLARAFRSAGAQSVLNTAWEVDGRVALPLMQTFYAKLAEGQNKSEALAQSTREFLDDAPPELLHPHYWAAFTLVGDNAPVQRPRAVWPAIGLFLLLTSLGLGALVRSRAKDEVVD
jgi:CHAT domain-containing protein